MPWAGWQAREANLRLDLESGAYAALKDDPTRHIIVKGDPLQSELLFAHLLHRHGRIDATPFIKPEAQSAGNKTD